MLATGPTAKKVKGTVIKIVANGTMKTLTTSGVIFFMIFSI